MVETLEEILKRQKLESEVATIQIFLTGKQARRLLRIAQRAIRRAAWVIQNIDRYPKEKQERVRKNAEDSAKFWEEIAVKIESQLGG